MTDFLETKRKEITDQLDRLKPAVEEYRRLEAAAAALDDLPASPNGGSAISPEPIRRRRGPGRPRASKASVALASKPASPELGAAGRPAAKRKPRRRKGLGKRAAQALALIDLLPDQIADRYLRSSKGDLAGRPFGFVGMVHARSMSL